MTQEQKQLLLTALCGYLPYGVICHTEKGDGYLCSINQTIFGTDYGLNINPLKRDYFNDSETDEQAIKPYLRPMSSMTKKERQFLLKFGTVGMDENDKVFDVYTFGLEKTMPVIDFLNSHHFDYRGLIEKGLALEAPEDMY